MDRYVDMQNFNFNNMNLSFVKNNSERDDLSWWLYGVEYKSESKKGQKAVFYWKPETQNMIVENSEGGETESNAEEEPGCSNLSRECVTRLQQRPPHTGSHLTVSARLRSTV